MLLFYEWGIGRGRKLLIFCSYSIGIWPFQLGVEEDEKFWQTESGRGIEKIVAQ